MPRVFVYGSLLSGLRYHRVMEGARALGPARTAPGYALLDLGDWPGATRGEGALVGEVYDVKKPHLEALDDFEDVPEMFVREQVALADGSSAWMYRLVDAELLARGRPVPDGCWRSHLRSEGRTG